MASLIPIYYLCYLGVLLLSIAAAAPNSFHLLWQDECIIHDTILELCQKCATKSKSSIVYPMCCEDREEARPWCESFLSYGLHDPGYK